MRVAPGLRADVVMSNDGRDNRETPSDFAAPDSVCLAVNGGYFTMDRTPAGHVGLLQINGRLVEPADAKSLLLREREQVLDVQRKAFPPDPLRGALEIGKAVLLRLLVGTNEEMRELPARDTCLRE